MGIYETQRHLMDQHGKSSRVLTIGLAGEKLCRIAVVSTGTQSAAGQGGYGAVMGSKNLKAIVVRGSGALNIAEPDNFLHVCKAIAEEAKVSHHAPGKPKLVSERVAKYGQRWQACTQGCTNQCRGARFYTHVPGCVYHKEYKGQLHCAATAFAGFPNTFFDWKLGFEAGFEIANLSNDWGLNHWDLLFGIIPWLRASVEAGYLRSLDGLVIDLDKPAFWVELLRRITSREGAGDVLAEGGRRAALILGIGEEIADALYPAWGCAGHWDGHGDHVNPIFFPFWLVSALQWAVDVRDPISSGHGYTQAIMSWSPSLSPNEGLSWEQLKQVGERVYGSPLATDPESGYAFKAEPAVWHGNRSMLKDSLAVDDQVFPRIFSKTSLDGFARTDGMDGPDFEWHLFKAATGSGLSLEEFYRCAERAVNLERALQIRHHGRSRQDDETVIPYFEHEENEVNPFLGRRQKLDREQFSTLLDAYYALRGWNCETGWPGPNKLRELDLGYVEEEMK
jgi:aldehyde:ferredoxin oxidoreductase